MSFRCYECGDITDSRQSLKTHISIDHLAWLPHQCTYCSTFKVSKCEIREHIRSKHPGKTEAFIYRPDDERKRHLETLLTQSMGGEVHSPFAQHTATIMPSIMPTQPRESQTPVFHSPLTPTPPPTTTTIGNNTNTAMTTNSRCIEIDSEISIVDAPIPPNEIKIQPPSDSDPVPETRRLSQVKVQYQTEQSTPPPILPAMIADDDDEDFALPFSPGRPYSPIIVTNITTNQPLPEGPNLKLKRVEVRKRTQPKEAIVVDEEPIITRIETKKPVVRKPVKLQLKEGRTPFTCQLCKNTLWHKESMKHHVASKHIQGIKMECKRCNFKSDSNSSFVMKAHYRAKHNGLEMIYRDRRSEYEAEVYEKLASCFPEEAVASLKKNMKKESSHADHFMKHVVLEYANNAEE